MNSLIHCWMIEYEVEPALLRALALALWGALRDGGTAKAQLLLRLMRQLPRLAPERVDASTWLLLAQTRLFVRDE
jgi:hypothetical protein